MRMEELSDNRYVKGPDSVEKYLLDLVHDYFKNNGTLGSEKSREFIIEKALERMREEIDFEAVGVLSITLPDGKERTGAVTISLEDLGGEPAIIPKRSAFNVNFGVLSGTACEGNDPRLSDKRHPLTHQHSIDEVLNLANELSTINGKIDRLNGHEHKNKGVLDKITYTGTKSVIDLADVEGIEQTVRDLIQAIEDDIAEYQTEINSKVNQVNTEIEIVRNEIAEIQRYVAETNQRYRQEAIDYSDQKIGVLKAEIDEAISNFVTKAMMVDIIRIASNAYVFFDKTTVNFNEILAAGSSTYELSVDDIISKIEEIHGTGLDDEDVAIEVTLKLYNRTYRLPYIIYEEDNVKGLITSIVTGLKVKISLECDLADIPADFINASITASYYMRQSVSLV